MGGTKAGGAIGENADVDHREDEGMAMGTHKKTERREDMAVRLDVDQGKMSITGKDVACGKDKEEQGSNHVGRAHRKSMDLWLSAWKHLVLGCQLSLALGS